MTDYIAIKLQNGTDLVGVEEHTLADDIVKVKHPIEIAVDPTYGYFAKSWLLLFNDDVTHIRKTDIITYGTASEKAIRYHKEFIEQMAANEVSTNEDTHDAVDDYSVEDILSSFIQSKTSKLH